MPPKRPHKGAPPTTLESAHTLARMLIPPHMDVTQGQKRRIAPSLGSATWHVPAAAFAATALAANNASTHARHARHAPRTLAAPGPEWERWSSVLTGRELRRTVGGREQAGTVLAQYKAVATLGPTDGSDTFTVRRLGGAHAGSGAMAARAPAYSY